TALVADAITYQFKRGVGMQFDTVEYQSVSDGLPYEKRADGKGEAKCIEGEIPFGLPVGWRWVRFSSFSLS
uniref:hypothetical protein n=1 Tax=Collinsella aerofaciens TaxID=74426 RepID=UPI001E65498B